MLSKNIKAKKYYNVKAFRVNKIGVSLVKIEKLLINAIYPNLCTKKIKSYFYQDYTFSKNKLSHVSHV